MKVKYLFFVCFFGCKSDLPFIQAVQSDVQFEAEYDITRIWFYDNQQGYALTRQGVVIATKDGSTWQETKVAASAVDLKSITFSDQNTGYVVGQSDIGHYLFSTTDGGSTWEEEEVYFDVKRIEAASPNVLYACSNNAVYKKVGDGYWQSVSEHKFSRENISRISFYNEQQGVLLTERALYKTEDGGDVWTEQRSFHDLSIADTDINETQGVILDRYGSFYTSSSGNETWNYHTNELPSRTHYRTVTLIEQHLYVSGDYDFLHSTDKGETWTSYRNEDGSSLGFVDIYFVDKQHGYGVSNGKIYKLFNGEAR